MEFDAKLSLAELRLTGSEIEDNCALMYDLDTSDKAFSEEMDVDSLLEDCGVSTAYWRLMIFAFLFVLTFQATGFISKACKTQCGKKKLEGSKVQFWNSCSFQTWGFVNQSKDDSTTIEWFPSDIYDHIYIYIYISPFGAPG